MADKTPDPVDVHVGARLRLRRKAINQSQEALAKHLGLTFQQVQKYERGVNRISASMMYRAAAAQGVDVAWYFEGLDQADRANGELDPLLAFGAAHGGLEIAGAYLTLDTQRQASILSVVRAIASSAALNTALVAA